MTMRMRLFCGVAVFLMIAAACGPALRAAPPDGQVVLGQIDFNPVAKQCTIADDGKTRSDAVFADGMLKYFPGPGTDAKGRVNWHGKVVTYRTQLYANYAIELQLAWNARDVRGGCRAFIEPRCGRNTELYAIFHLDQRAVEFKDTAQTVGYVGGLPEAGSGVLRLERNGRTLAGFWEGKRVAETTDDTPQAVDSFVVHLKNLAQSKHEGWIGLAGATVSVPKPDLELAAAPIPGRAGQQQKMVALAREMQGVLADLSARAYKRETTLDVLGFDLAAIKDKPEHGGLAQRVRAFGEKALVVNRLREPAARLTQRSGDAAQFFERVPAETITKIETDAAALKEEIARTFAPIDAEEQLLRKELAALRPANTAPRQSNRDWARNRFHIYWFNHYGNVPPGYDDSVRYMGEMGATALQEWYYRGERRHGKWEEYVAEWQRKLGLLQRENMRMFITEGDAIPLHPHPDNREKAQKGIEQYLKTFGDHPAFAGIEFDEVHYGYCWCRTCLPMFHEYVKKRFSATELKTLGLVKEKADEVDQIGIPTKDERQTNPVLYTLRMEWRAQVFEEITRAVYDRARELKPDAMMHMLLSPANFASFTNRDWGGPFAAPLYRMAAISDMISIDPYWNGVPEEAYWCDLMRAHAKGPALLTVGTHYDARTVDSFERDLCIPFAHADGMYVFDWIYCFKQPPYMQPAWVSDWSPAGKWEKVWSVAAKARKLEPYLIQTEPPRAVALLHSMRSQAVGRDMSDLAGVEPGAKGRPDLYTMRQGGLYSLFRQARIQPDPVFVEGLTPETLRQYPILYVQNAVTLTPEEEAMLRAWVREGGRLIATASTSILDRWGRPQKDYGLADVFGVSYVKTQTVDSVKLAARPEVQYSGAVDVVRTTTGKALLSWPDGAPALVGNAFGKGHCTFVTARDLGTSFTAVERGAERPCFSVHRTFSPGVVDFVRGLVAAELSGAGKTPPFDAQDCPPEVEVTVRTQKAGAVDRRVVHLLNYGFRTPVAGVRVSLPAAAGRQLKAFYPLDGADLPCEMQGGRVVLPVRNFSVYEAVVVETR